MAAVKITPDNNGAWATCKGDRYIFRTVSGNIYALIAQRMYKSSDGGASWTEKDIANKPTPADTNLMDADIDSTGIIHVIYCDTITTVDYITFNTGTDAWGTTAKIADVTALAANGGYALKIDSNDIPHAVFIDNAGSPVFYYLNRIGGNWNVPVSVLAGNVNYPLLLINASNIPIIIYYRSTGATVVACLGNQNNATSFTSQTVGSQQLRGLSACIDSNGDIWIAKAVEPTGSGTGLYLIQHIAADNWTTWQSEITIDSTARNSMPSIAAKNDKLHILCSQTEIGSFVKAGVIYHTNVSGSWVTTSLEAGSYNNVRIRWGYRNNPSYDTYPLDYSYRNNTDAEQYWNYIDISSPSYKGMMFPRGW